MGVIISSATKVESLYFTGNILSHPIRDDIKNCNFCLGLQVTCCYCNITNRARPFIVVQMGVGALKSPHIGGGGVQKMVKCGQIYFYNPGYGCRTRFSTLMNLPSGMQQPQPASNTTQLPAQIITQNPLPQPAANGTQPSEYVSIGKLPQYSFKGKHGATPAIQNPIYMHASIGNQDLPAPTGKHNPPSYSEGNLIVVS